MNGKIVHSDIEHNARKSHRNANVLSKRSYPAECAYCSPKAALSGITVVCEEEVYLNGLRWIFPDNI